MRRVVWLPALTLAVLLAGAPAVRAETPAVDAFGVIKAPSFDQAKKEALGWLQQSGADAITLKQAEDLWDPKVDRPLLDRVAETLILGDVEARELMILARDPGAPAPTEVPELLKDPSKPLFFRANLGLYFAKQLANKRVYEECLETLKAFKPEHVVDPASYFFFKAVAENRLLRKDDGLQTIHNLMTKVADAPERYTVVATLMRVEMESWKAEDLADIARRMKEVEARLDISRGGQVTQKKQEDIVAMLDQMIKELEKQCGA